MSESDPFSAAHASLDDLLDRSNLTGRQFLIYAGQRLHPGLALYNSVYAIRWPGAQPERFRRAWQRLVDSCDALRIIVEETGGVPQQRVLPSLASEVECVELLSEREPEAAVSKWVATRLERPLILAERVFDTALLHAVDDEYVWFLHIHHIVVDGAGVQVLIRRLTELYIADASDANAPAPPQFADHVARACAQRTSDAYRAARSYWRAFFEDSPEMPRFYGTGVTDGTRQERVVLRLDAASATAFDALARSLVGPSMSEDAAKANLFNALFAAYLNRVSGGESIAIGVTFHNRSSETDRHTVGLFMEVVPIRLRIEPQASLAGLARQVASSIAAALKHRTFSVGHSERAPAFSGLFNYMRALAGPAVPLDVRRVHGGMGSNALSLSIEPQGESYELWFDVNDEIAATSSAKSLGAHLLALIEGAVEKPNEPLTSVSLLSQAESEAIITHCRGPALPLSQDRACHSPFEMNAMRTPKAVALAFGDTELSYADLNARANRLARKLKSLGARPGKRVGICLERSPDMVIAVLAVLKSGAAYVPLDPGYPAARLQAMLSDADNVALVMTHQTAAFLPPHAARCLYIEDPIPSAEGSNDNLHIALDSHDIAYVMYTSGSTGTPKGVLVSHGGVSNHLAWRASFFPVTPTDRCLQSASLNFDDSVWEILEPLSAGACVVLTRPRYEYDSAYLVGLMAEERISVACFVPSLLRAVVEEPAVGSCRALRRLTTGGERVTLALLRRVLERLPGVRLYNGYGTTETTIASLYWLCTDAGPQSSVPVGRPIANTQVYVLDRNRHVVPPGVVGEIYIGGAGVANGYLNRPELTAAAFVADEQAGAPDAKLYRTGDLGRLRADGVFEFAGRADDQVKIRGVRVELGEIEAAILDHRAVRAAAVVCDDTARGKLLRAFVVASDPALSVAGLRAFVRERIPSGLVPNRFELLAALPLTPNGKLDRRALPASSDADDPISHVAPRSDFERELVGLWEEALEARPIGINDDFFALGGHSLSAVSVAAAIEKLLGRSVSPGILFEAPTIEQLASRLATAEAAGGALVLLAPGQGGAPLFLVHHVSGDVTSYRDLARHLSTGRPVYGLRAPELDTNERPPDRVESIASRYVREVRGVQPCGPYLLGGHSAGAHIAFEMAQQLRSDGEPIALLAILEADARTPGGGRSLGDALRFHLQTLRALRGGQRAVYLWRQFLSWRERRPAAPAAPTSERGSAAPKNAVWAAIERAVRSYQPRAYPGFVTLLRATDRSVTRTYSRTLGWGRLAQGGIRVIDVPGSHSTVLKPGTEPPMAAKLRACLEELDSDEIPRSAA